MKCPEKVVFAFNPKQKLFLDDKTSMILWACIKTGHITSQYYDKDIQDTSERIKKINPKTYKAFMQIIETSPLREFGTVMSGFAECYRNMDDEFWWGIWEYIKGEKELKIKIKGATQ